MSDKIELRSFGGYSDEFARSVCLQVGVVHSGNSCADGGAGREPLLNLNRFASGFRVINSNS